MKVKENRHQVLIIGGGASGMMAAICAARKGADTGIMEHTKMLGKKILVTGNGRCNLTNSVQKPEYYRSSSPKFPWEAVQQFDEKAAMVFFKDLGLLFKDRNGYLYPYSNQAASVRQILEGEVRNLGISVYLDTSPVEVAVEPWGFCCKASEGMRFTGQRLILAAGSKASPKTGSDGSGYELAGKLGHHIIKPLPALVQLTSSEGFFKQLAGIRTDAAVSLYIDGKKKLGDMGELQLTDYGLSGIPTFQISRYAVAALDRKQKVHAVIDFLPVLKENELKALLLGQTQTGGKSIEAALKGCLNEKLAMVLLKEAHIRPGSRKLADQELYRLVKILKSFKVPISGSKSFDQGQVCQGGVDTSQVNSSTMESKQVSGLFFAGEILDVDGACGGYNLQWAWTSGYLAGTHAAKGLSMMKNVREYD